VHAQCTRQDRFRRLNSAAAPSVIPIIRHDRPRSTSACRHARCACAASRKATVTTRGRVSICDPPSVAALCVSCPIESSFLKRGAAVQAVHVVHNTITIDTARTLASRPMPSGAVQLSAPQRHAELCVRIKLSQHIAMTRDLCTGIDSSMRQDRLILTHFDRSCS